MVTNRRRVLVTGGDSFLGINIAAALLAEGVEVTLLIREGTEDKLSAIADRVRWFPVDVWDPASLGGRARNHISVIHTVGSMLANPAQGLTYHRLNFLSARNAANMSVRDGVPHFILLSGVQAPWISRGYMQSKREAEKYTERIGLKTSVIRAPIAYVRGASRPLFYQLMTLFGFIPPFSWTYLGKIAPIPVDVLARGVARIAIADSHEKKVYFARDLRQKNQSSELHGKAPSIPQTIVTPQSMHINHGIELLDENAPFAWSPPEES